METSCLKNKNCLITGATGGIGKEVSIQLADQSCNLFLTGRDKQKLESLKKLLIKNNPEAVQDYLSGKETVVKFLVGQMMKISRGKANPQLVNEILKAKLK